MLPIEIILYIGIRRGPGSLWREAWRRRQAKGGVQAKLETRNILNSSILALESNKSSALKISLVIASFALINLARIISSSSVYKTIIS